MMSDNHISCEWVMENIEAYLDHELDSGDVSKLESHLRECYPCADELALARRVKDALGSLPEQRCPDEVVSAALDHIGITPATSRERPREPWFAGIFKHGWGMAIAAALVLAIVIPVFLNISQRPQPTPEITPQELAITQQQIEMTFAYIGYVSYNSTSTVSENVIENDVIQPIKKAFLDLKITKGIPFTYSNS